MAKYFIRPREDVSVEEFVKSAPQIHRSFAVRTDSELPPSSPATDDKYFDSNLQERLLSEDEESHRQQESDFYYSAVDLGEVLNLLGFGRFQLKIILLMSLFTVALGVQSLSLSYLMPMLQKQLGVDHFIIAWLPTTWYIGTLLGSFVFGIIGDRKGRKIGILLSAFLAAVFSLCSAFTSNIWVLMGLRSVVAFGVGGSQPVCIAYLIEYAPDSKRGVIILLIEACRITGGFLAVGLAWLFDSDYPLYLISLSAMMLAALLVLTPCLPESVRYHHFIKNYGRVATVINKIARDNGKTFEVEPYLTGSGASSSAPPK